MSDTILSGDFTVYYTNDTGGDKQIRWTGTTGTYTVRQLYSALMDLFDNSTNMDEGVPIEAVTPTQYNFGRIETNDNEPWFIDHDAIEHLSGGSITSIGYNRTPYPANGTGTIGIIEIEYSVGGGTDFATSDIGKTVTHTNGDSGTLLHFTTNGSTGEAVIRPDSNTSADDFQTTGTSLSVTGGVGSGLNLTVAGITGNDLYSNIYTIGTIEDETQIYVIKNGLAITPWWNSGHIDILVEVQESGTLIDNGVLSIFARKYGSLYDHFVLDASAGGRNPVPLATSSDRNNITGYRTLTGQSGVSDFDVGNYFYAPAAGGWSAATKKGRIFAVTGTASAPIIEYSLMGDLTDFANTDTIKEYDPEAGADGDGSATVNGSPTDTGIASLTGITYTFGATLQDISNGNGSRPYNVTINCGGNSIQDFYEHTKYRTRRGETTTLDGEEGQQYIGSGDIYLYFQADGGFTEGLQVTGGTSGATGWIVAAHTYNPYYLTLRDVRGTFQDNELVTDTSTGSATTTLSNAVEQITISKSAPFGTFAGGKFFGARGVHIYNMAGGDANNYSLIDSENVPQDPPATIAITVSNTQSGDRVSVFRATDTSGTIDKTYLTSHNTNNVVGDTTFDVDAGTPIPQDTPSSGTLRVVDNPGEKDHRFRYASWTGSTFTLVTSGIPSGTIDSAGTNPATSFRATNANLANILPGDIVRNTTDSPNSWAHVISVTLVTGTTYDVSHTNLQGGTSNIWSASDGYQFNTLPVTYNNSDTAYVPYIETTASGTTTSTSVQYDTDRNISARVRIKGIQPYINNTTQLTSTGYSTSVTRIDDTIVS